MWKAIFSFCAVLTAAVLTAEEPVAIAVSKLGSDAELVVHGRAEAITVQRDERNRIFTEVEVRVIDTWKGKPPGEVLLLVHPGGVLGEIATVASGQPEYKVGEEVVLFCARNAAGKYVTLGLGNGKFTVKDGYALNPNTKPQKLSLSELKTQVTNE